MKAGIHLVVLSFLLVFMLGSCVVRGPIAPYYHRHSPHHFFAFRYWASPFGRPYSRARHTPHSYRSRPPGRKRDRHHYWPKSFVPHSPYFHPTYRS